MRYFRLIMFVGLVVLNGGTASAQGEKARPERIELWSKHAPIGDGKFQDSEVWITLHRPEKPNGTAIVICPGGGYGGLVTGAEGHGIASWLNRHHITGVVLEYRLPGGRSNVPLYDAQRALRTVRANAKAWNLDLARIGIMGFSAGGHLASTAGTHFDKGEPNSADPVQRVSCRPDFMILVYPVITMTAKGHSGSRNNLLGKNPDTKLIELFSNEKQVSENTPPTFLAHAKDDKPVPPENSRMFYDALRAKKVPAQYLELPSGGHGLNGYEGPMWNAWQERSLQWLEEMKLVQNPNPDKDKNAAEKTRPEPAKAKLGLLVNEAHAYRGYTLLAPTNSTQTYLIDMQGRVVQTWKSDCTPGLSAYLLENGHLLRTGQIRNPPFFGGGTGGRIQEFTWDGELVWDFTFYSDTHLPNHDICKLPNGNVLMIVWEKKLPKEAIAAGRRPETASKDHLLADCILEVQPTGKTSGKIVWEWHSWDHLIQDFDPKKANHGDVSAHPELLDLNFGTSTIAAMAAKTAGLEKLRGIGYVGGAGRRPQPVQPDWLHINAVAYNAELDQIMLTVYEFSEIWIIDHSTRTTEAAAHQGGRYGKGGDLLYRWGNPRAYRAGSVKDQKLFGPHNAHWIDKGLPGEGHALIFNNGLQRTGGAYSTVDEIAMPLNKQGGYAFGPGKAFGPDKVAWSYAAPKKIDFYAPFISGAQRLPNGNTLICSGTNGTVFEVTSNKELVWKYVNPDRGSLLPGGGAPLPPTPQLGEILPSFLQGAMNFTTEQKKQLKATEKDIEAKLGKVLTEEQKKQFQQRPRGFEDFPVAGHVMASSVEKRLKLTGEQKQQLAAVQKEVDTKLDMLLKDAQKKQLKSMQDLARAFQAGGARNAIPGGFGPPGGGGLFRAPRYGVAYAGLIDKKLTPGKTIEEILETNPSKQSQQR